MRRLIIICKPSVHVFLSTVVGSSFIFNSPPENLKLFNIAKYNIVYMQ